MFNWTARIISNWVALMVVAGVFENYFQVGNQFKIVDVKTAFFAALILSLVNAVVKPLLIFFTLPITIVTFGLFLLVINAVTLLITAALIDGFTIGSFSYALMAGVVISVLNFLIQKIVIDGLKK